MDLNKLYFDFRWVSKSYKICFLLVLLIFSCDKNQTPKKSFNKTFENKIDEGDTVVEKLCCSEGVDSEYYGYFENTNFDDIFFIYDLVDYDVYFKKVIQDSYKYYETAKYLLCSDDVRTRNKEIICLTMCELTLKKRIEFLDFVFELYLDGKVNETCVYYSITSKPIEKKPVFYINYKDNEVKQILNKIRSHERTDKSIITQIDMILSGEWYNIGLDKDWDWAK